MDDPTKQKSHRFCPMCGNRLERRQIAGQQRPACPNCSHVIYLDPKLVVLVVIEINDKLVLGRRRIGAGEGLWTFPSGFVDRGESLHEAAIRETREETGLEVKIEQLIGIYSNNGNPIILVAYIGIVVGGSMEIGDEMDKVALFDPNNLPPMAFDSNERIIIDWRQVFKAST
jgi:8-oxo-dGTP diphosphatase